MIVEKICFPKNSFLQTIGLFIIIIIIIFVFITYYLILKEQKIYIQVPLKTELKTELNKTYAGDFGGTAGATRKYISPYQKDSDINYKQIGFLYDNNNNRYPLYGRFLYQNRSDLWEYYIVDDSRNRLRIGFKSPNNKEIFNGDSVVVPSVGTLNATIYDVEQYKYNY